MKVQVHNTYEGQKESILFAIKAMRSSWESYKKSDSFLNKEGAVVIGAEDMHLMRLLLNSGPEHSKFMRMIPAYLEIEAPLFWWKQFDTYKIGTSTSSESTMHTLMRKELTINDFEPLDFWTSLEKSTLEIVVENINTLIMHYRSEKDLKNKENMEHYFNAVITLLPDGYLQKRYVATNYAVLRNICQQRMGHKLSQWKTFIQAIDQQMPYSMLIIDSNTAADCQDG